MEKLLFADTFKKGLQSLLRVPKVVIDDPVFRLHYRATGLALFFFSLLVSGYQFFGQPILCIQRDDIPTHLLNTYCWIEGTFTLPKALSKKVGDQIVYPGVENYQEGDEVIEHGYYQWTCFLLFLQAVMFVIPYGIWHSLEGGRMKALIMKLKNPVLDPDDSESSYKEIANYFSRRRKQHNRYALKYLFCEILNFVNVLGQLYFVNRFLGGLFLDYGPNVVKFVSEEQENRVDPMIKVFPRITKCTFHKYGSSGDVQKHDALCLLPLNIINEKLFVILWFWFVILAILGGIVIIYRLSILFFKGMRIFLLNRVSSLSKREDIVELLSHFAFGDWLLLYFLADNIENFHYERFVKELIKDEYSLGYMSDVRVIGMDQNPKKITEKETTAPLLKSRSSIA